MARIELDKDEIFTLANNSAPAKAGVKKVAAATASRARKELARAKIDATVSIRERPLSTGRVSYDVVVDAPDGRERQANRILRRSASGRSGRQGR